MIQAKIHDFPGRQVRLEFNIPEAWSQSKMTDFVMNSLFSFSKDFIEFLSADLWITYFDTETLYPEYDIEPEQPYWMLKKIGTDPRLIISQTWENEKSVDAESISLNAISNWINGALEVNKKDGIEFEPTWRQLSFLNTSCNSGLFENDFKDETISVYELNNVFEYPFELRENKIWVSGPFFQKSLSAPIKLSLDNFFGTVTLEISLNWSFWTDDDSPGFSNVQEAIAGLVEKGWEFQS